MDNGGIHWSWDNSKPTYFGFVRRGGDGKDVRWIQGPTRSATHVMGAFDDDKMLVVDVEMSMSNPFPFMPMQDGSRWDPVAGSSHITRLTVDLIETAAVGVRHRADVSARRRAAAPGRSLQHGAVPLRLPGLPGSGNAAPGTGGACYARFDHQNRTSTLFNAGTETSLAECCFAPKSQNAPEGRGYLMGLATRNTEGRPLRSRDPRRRAPGRRAGCDGAPADARARPGARLVGAGVADADGVISRDLFAAS